MDRTLAAAEAVISARRSGTPPDTLPPTIKPQTVAEGYGVQKAAHEILAETKWGQVIGYKIGCTTLRSRIRSRPSRSDVAALTRNITRPGRNGSRGSPVPW